MALGIGSGLSFNSSLQDCNWVRIYYNSDQANNHGIMWTDTHTNTWGGITRSAGDDYFFSAQMYLAGDWEGTDPVTFKVTMASKWKEFEIAQNTVVTINTDSTSYTSGMGNNWNSTFYLYQASSDASDYPDAGASMYLRNVRIEIKDSGGNSKYIFEPDISTGGNSFVDDYSVNGTALTKTVGECLP